MNYDKSFKASLQQIREATVKIVMDRLGPEAQQPADQMAEFMVEHYRKLTEDGAGVLMIDPAASAADLGRQMQEHSQMLIETALSSLALVLGRAIGVGFSFGRGQS